MPALPQQIRTASFRLLGEVISRSPLDRYLNAGYPYMQSPAQLCFLCHCLDATRNLRGGAIVELGCARGQTTAFLNQHMDIEGIEKPYFCVDTFEGFTAADIAVEVTRGKDPRKLAGFRTNRKEWFDRSMRHNGFHRVVSYQADVATFDFNLVGEIALCLIDVDVYRPVKAALPQVYDRMVEGGIIVVDDCLPDRLFDGAYQAYREFVAECGLPETLAPRGHGVIEVRRVEATAPL